MEVMCEVFRKAAAGTKDTQLRITVWVIADKQLPK